MRAFLRADLAAEQRGEDHQAALRRAGAERPARAAQRGRADGRDREEERHAGLVPDGQGRGPRLRQEEERRTSSSTRRSRSSAGTCLNPLTEALRAEGHARLTAAEVGALVAPHGDALAALAPSWNTLAQDLYLRDGGRYRARRHACFVQELEPAALVRCRTARTGSRPTYNALHGGLERWFAPDRPTRSRRAGMDASADRTGHACSRRLRPVPRWYIEAHQFRIDTATASAGRRRRARTATASTTSRRAGRPRARDRWRDARLPADSGTACASRSPSHGPRCCSTMRASCTRRRRSSRRRARRAGATRWS